MSALMWGWAAAWLGWCLGLEWRVDRSWLPGTQEIREDYSRWSVPPADALTDEGARLWRLRYRVTGWGFAGWLVLLVAWLAA